MMLALSDFARCGAAACANKNGMRRLSATERSHISCVQSLQRRREHEGRSDQHRVQRAVSGDRLVHDIRWRVRLRQVALDETDGAGSLLSDQIRGLRAMVHQQHVVPARAKSAHRGAPDTRSLRLQ